MNDTLPILITLCAYGLVMLVAGAWIYSLGVRRLSPVPVVKFNKSEAKPEPPATPKIKCPHCHDGPDWLLSSDQSVWICQKCRNTIPGLRARVTG